MKNLYYCEMQGRIEYCEKSVNLKIESYFLIFFDRERFVWENLTSRGKQ